MNKEYYSKYRRITLNNSAVFLKYFRVTGEKKLFNANLCLIDDFLPHDSIMNNLAWISSHINIIIH